MAHPELAGLLTYLEIDRLVGQAGLSWDDISALCDVSSSSFTWWSHHEGLRVPKSRKRRQASICKHLIFLINYFWLCWVFVAVLRLSLVVASGASGVQTYCSGFSCYGAEALGHTGFIGCSTWAQFSSYGAQAYLLHSMWHLSSLTRD